MICVSYTRSLSNNLAIESPNNAIGLQNEAITEYLKKKGWKLAGKYTDRKHDREDETSFLKMKQDGIDRKFECVVFYSLFYCGKKFTSATDLLCHVFYPAGIHFAVAEDDFCSAEVTPEEVDAYISKVRHEYRAVNSSRIATRFNPKTIYKRYGFIRVGEEELEIDPESAAVVRDIFQMSYDGKPMKEIADLLNENGVESCMAYRRRKTGMEYKHGRKGWNASAVSGILENRIYMGEWKRIIRGEEILISCPPIVSPEMFSKTRRKILDRDYSKGARQSNPGRSLFTRKIVDQETSWPLGVYVLSKDKSRIFRFRYPSPAHNSYESLYLPCKEVEQEVGKLLLTEKRKADRAMNMLSTPEMKAAKERRIAPLREQANTVFQKMIELENLSSALSNPEQTASEMSILDNELQGCMDAMNEIIVAFSEKNPWLKLYQKMELGEEVTAPIVKKYVCMVKIYRFETVNLTPYHEEWFLRLPQEWFSDLKEK